MFLVTDYIHPGIGLLHGPCVHKFRQGHEVIHGEANRLLDRKRMRRELRAFEHNSTDIRMLVDALFGEVNQLFFKTFRTECSLLGL